MAEPTEEKKPGALMRLIKAGAIIATLVVVEMVGAAMLIPSAEETEELARELARASRGEEAAADEGSDSDPLDRGEETREVELHTANITRFNPDTDTTLNVDFTVFGVVLADEADEFQQLYDSNTSRVREQIVMTMHGADATDLANAGLGLIKRQILENTNRALGKPLMREVVFTKINFVER